MQNVQKPELIATIPESFINDKFIYSLQYILKYLNMNSTLIVRSAKFMGCLTYHTV